MSRPERSYGTLRPDPATAPITAPLFPLLTRVIFAIRLWIFKAGVYVGLGILRFCRPGIFLKSRPSFIKSYPGYSLYPVRVFLPSGSALRSASVKYPTYINIHGGGFALCDAGVDDPFSHTLSQHHNLLVISINYPKAPRYPFPDLLDVTAAIVELVLADPNLPIDTSKVAMGGFSAGGNIALSLAALPTIRHSIRALVSVYSVVDFSGRYKGTFRRMKTGRNDFLVNTGKLFSWGYVNPETDLTDPRLSPVYATREMLPQRMLFIGAEYDILCQEAAVMARKMAGFEDWKDIREGGPEMEAGWEKNGVKFMMVKDAQHGFTHVSYRGQEEEKRKEKTNMTFREIGEWVQNIGLGGKGEDY